MSLALRRPNDNFAGLPYLAGLHVSRVFDSAFMATLQSRDAAEIATRFADGHRAYVAYLHGQPAAWGWAATRAANIGELDTAFQIAPRARYLWNFVTLEQYRGLGIYPRLLDAIVSAESDESDEFWVAYAPENHASAAGIHKAGFITIAQLSFDANGAAAVSGITSDGGSAAAAFLGLRETNIQLAPCWRCVRNGSPHTCREGYCKCDYQRPAASCNIAAVV